MIRTLEELKKYGNVRNLGVTNAISGKDTRGVAKTLMDDAIEEINNINNTYLAGMESLLKVEPRREWLLKENVRLIQELATLQDKYDAIKHLLDPDRVREHEYIQKREQEDNKKEK